MKIKTIKPADVSAALLFAVYAFGMATMLSLIMRSMFGYVIVISGIVLMIVVYHLLVKLFDFVSKQNLPERLADYWNSKIANDNAGSDNNG